MPYRAPYYHDNVQPEIPYCDVLELVTMVLAAKGNLVEQTQLQCSFFLDKRIGIDWS